MLRSPALHDFPSQYPTFCLPSPLLLLSEFRKWGYPSDLPRLSESSRLVLLSGRYHLMTGGLALSAEIDIISSIYIEKGHFSCRLDIAVTSPLCRPLLCELFVLLVDQYQVVHLTSAPPKLIQQCSAYFSQPSSSSFFSSYPLCMQLPQEETQTFQNPTQDTPLYHPKLRKLPNTSAARPPTNSSIVEANATTPLDHIARFMRIVRSVVELSVNQQRTAPKTSPTGRKILDVKSRHHHG